MTENEISKVVVIPNPATLPSHEYLFPFATLRLCVFALKTPATFAQRLGVRPGP